MTDIQIIEQIIAAIQSQSGLILTLTLSTYLLSFSVILIMIVVWNVNKRIMKMENIQNEPLELDSDKQFRGLLKLDQE